MRRMGLMAEYWIREAAMQFGPNTRLLIGRVTLHLIAIGTGLGGDMTRTHDYQIINDTAPAIEIALATRTADGWRPVLMSTATVNTAVQVFIVLEKPIPSPYTK
jgi:hypothetical protein